MTTNRPPMPEGMWTCRACRAWNNDIRNYCYKCTAAKAHLPCGMCGGRGSVPATEYGDPARQQPVAIRVNCPRCMD
jgi:hypothetical protein